MSAAAAVQAPWFGELLDWRRDDQAHEWWALYAGREYRLRKLGREVTGGRPGWYLTRHPDDKEHDGGHAGPRTGRTLDTARQIAEVWAVVEAADRIPYNDASSFLTVMSNGGAVFPTPGGRMLLAWPDPERGRILIHADRPQAAGLFTPGPHVATVTPILAVPTRPALYPVTVTWQPSVMDTPGLPAEATWRAAARSIGHAIKMIKVLGSRRCNEVAPTGRHRRDHLTAYAQGPGVSLRTAAAL